MAKIKMWIVLFIVGIVMILGASEFSRLLANETNWYTAGIMVSAISGLGLLFEMYFRSFGIPVNCLFVYTIFDLA